MYVPKPFEETDQGAIGDLLLANPLATLVAQAEDGLVANHIPLLMVKDKLIGHVAKANDLHEVLSDGAPVLAIFQGEDAYISPNWYPSKAKHHRHVPTWNYEVVHIHGQISFSHDEKAKRAVVGRLTQVMERATNGSDGWRMADAPADYMAQMLEGIVAFEITDLTILGKSKRSQNREPRDHDNVADEMEVRGETGLAERMKTHAKNS